MEILHFETIQPNYLLYILLLIWGVVCLGIGIGSLIIPVFHDKTPSWTFVFIELVCGISLIIINIFQLTDSTPVKYIYARIDNTVPYVELADKYEFIEMQGNVYKLKELSP